MFTKTRMPSDGSTGPFPIGFDYRDGTSIKVSVQDTSVSTPVQVAFTFVGSKTSDKPSGTSVQLAQAVPVGKIITIYKDIDLTKLPVNWSNGAELSEPNLESSDTGLMEMAQTAADLAEEAVRLAADAFENSGSDVVETIEAIGAQVIATKAEVEDLVEGVADNAAQAQAAADALAALGTPFSITNGGTGASNAEQARSNLGLGSAAVSNVGNSPGQVPAVEPSGKLSSSITPRLTGHVIQSVFQPIYGLALSSAVIPFDDSIPQITEGTQLTFVNITPTKATNKIRVEFGVYCSNNSTSAWNLVSAFRGGVSDALTCSTSFYGAANYLTHMTGVWEGLAGSTEQLTFSLRFGPHTSATVAVNGTVSGGRYLGGVYSSWFRVSEIEA